jgi:hypothetical protein
MMFSVEEMYSCAKISHSERWGRKSGARSCVTAFDFAIQVPNASIYAFPALKMQSGALAETHSAKRCRRGLFRFFYPFLAPHPAHSPNKTGRRRVPVSVPSIFWFPCVLLFIMRGFLCVVAVLASVAVAGSFFQFSCSTQKFLDSDTADASCWTRPCRPPLIYYSLCTINSFLMLSI